MNAPRRHFSGPELQGKTSYRVHDLLLDFARKKLQASGTLPDVQRVFVKTLRGQCVNGEWTTTSSNSQKDYYFKYLPYHLHSSEQHSELLQLFFHFHWLEQKVKHTNFPTLISDFRFLDTPLQHEIKLLKKSLMLSADAIEKNTSSIGPQLLGNKNNVPCLGLASLTFKHSLIIHKILGKLCQPSCHVKTLYI
jgi:hypothetical protein